jgi:hypothetical protein
MDAQQWDERYRAGQQWSTEPNRFFAEAVPLLDVNRPGHRSAVVGRNAVGLPAWVEGHRGRLGRRHRPRAAMAPRQVSRRLSSPTSWGSPGVACTTRAHVYLHWPTAEREPFLQRVAAAVAPGGHLVMVGHDRTNIEQGHGGPQDPDVLSTPEELAASLTAAGLDVLDARIVEREVTIDVSHLTAEQAAPMVTHAIDHLVARRVIASGSEWGEGLRPRDTRCWCRHHRLEPQRGHAEGERVIGPRHDFRS